MASDRAVSRRMLNRTTLARQLLIERRPLSPSDAVEHLVGLQAQVPLAPYTALWARLADFDPVDLGQLLVERRVVRIVSIRGTLHLLSARDCGELWALFRTVYERELANHPATKATPSSLDVPSLLEWARRELASPVPLPRLKAVIRRDHPALDPAAVVLVCRNRLGVVQAPPRGVWGHRGQISLVSAEAWLGRPLAAVAVLEPLVLRYLAAFGPATVADLATWSRLTGLGEIIEGLAPRLRVRHDEDGRALWDVEDGVLVDPETPAPVRFLPEYDNVLLSHADRRRFGDREVGALYPPGQLGRGHVLVDGFLRASWRLAEHTIEIRHLPMPPRDLRAVEAEGDALARFLRPERPSALTLVAVEGA